MWLVGEEHFSLSPEEPAMTSPLRRNAVDFGLPLLNNAQCAKLFVESLSRKMREGGLRSYSEGRIPSEVRSWAEFIGSKA